MFLITNRLIVQLPDGSVTLGDTPNSSGPKELRAVEVKRSGSRRTLEAVPDTIPEDLLPRESKIGKTLRDLGLADAQGNYPGSAYVALRMLEKINAIPKRNRNLLIYVHGYNTSVESVIKTAETLEAEYPVVCLPFTWPSNGGGKEIWHDARGLASYLSDKQDARDSVNALDRFVSRLYDYIQNLNAETRKQVEVEAILRFPDDAEGRRIFLAKAIDDICPVTVNILLHSMGNYLFEYVLKSESNRSSQLLVFDNIVLASADVNNADHSSWVDRIPFRRNLYVTLNEDDFALNASRMKLGQEQKPRLGSFRHGLHAQNAKYVDFTNAPKVGTAHTYFLEAPIENPRIKSFFATAFTGGRGEEQPRIRYQPAENVYQLA